MVCKNQIVNIVCRHLWFIITNSENAVSQSEHEVNTVYYPCRTREMAREFLLLIGWEKELVCADWTEQLARVLWELSVQLLPCVVLSGLQFIWKPLPLFLLFFNCDQYCRKFVCVCFSHPRIRFVLFVAGTG